MLRYDDDLFLRVRSSKANEISQFIIPHESENKRKHNEGKETRSHPEMVGDMSRVTLHFDLSKIPLVFFSSQLGSRPILTPKINPTFTGSHLQRLQTPTTTTTTTMTPALTTPDATHTRPQYNH